MKLKRSIALRASTALIAGLAVAGAYADPGMGGMGPTGGGMGMGGGGMMMGHGMMGGHFGSDHTAMIETRLGTLKSELKLTANQELAWQKFEDASKRQAVAMQKLHDTAQTTPTTPQSTPERLARHTEFMQQRVAGMQAVSSALTELYAVLTPAQKAIVDQGFGPMAGRHAGLLARNR
jgi:LTXXQ motif family protein